MAEGFLEDIDVSQLEAEVMPPPEPSAWDNAWGMAKDVGQSVYDFTSQAAQVDPTGASSLGRAALDVGKGAIDIGTGIANDPMKFGRDVAAGTAKSGVSLGSAALGAKMGAPFGPYGLVGGGILGFLGGQIAGEEVAQPIRGREQSIGENLIDVGFDAIPGGAIVNRSRQAMKAATSPSVKAIAELVEAGGEKVIKKGNLIDVQAEANTVPFGRVEEFATRGTGTPDEQFINAWATRAGAVSDETTSSYGTQENLKRFLEPSADEAFEPVRQQAVKEVADSGVLASGDNIIETRRSLSNAKKLAMEEREAIVAASTTPLNSQAVVEDISQNVLSKEQGTYAGNEYVEGVATQIQQDIAPLASRAEVSATDLLRARESLTARRRASGDFLKAQQGAMAKGNAADTMQAEVEARMYDNAIKAIDSQLEQVVDFPAFQKANTKYGLLDQLEELSNKQEVFSKRSGSIVASTRLSEQNKAGEEAANRIIMSPSIPQTAINVANAGVRAVTGAVKPAPVSNATSGIAASNKAFTQISKEGRSLDKIRQMRNAGTFESEAWKVPDAIGIRGAAWEGGKASLASEATKQLEAPQFQTPVDPARVKELAQSIDYALGQTGLTDTRLDGYLPRTDITNYNPEHFLTAFLTKTGGDPVAQQLASQFSAAVAAGPAGKEKINAVVEGMAKTYPGIFQPGFGVEGRIRNADLQNEYMQYLERRVAKGEIPPHVLSAQQAAFNRPGDYEIIPLDK